MQQKDATLQEQASPFRLKPLAPIHIGSGELLDPMSYIIDEQGKHLYFIDLPAWVEDHPDPERLASEFATKPMGALRGIVSKDLDPHLYSFASATIRSEQVAATYKRELRNQQGQNQLFIDPALKNPLSGALIIPGSSVKGALRTPVIDYLDRKYDLNLKRNPQGVEDSLKPVLGQITENSFQNLKMGDFEAKVGASSIVTAKEMRIKAGEKKNLTQKNPCEVIRNLLMDGEQEAVYGRVLIGSHNADRRDSVFTIQRGRYSERWTLEELLALCKNFYGMKFLQEKKKFFDLPHFAEARTHLSPMEKVLHGLKDTEALIRLGRYSHVECMTINENEPQRRRLKNGTLLPSGTTRTLANALYPFGWAKLSLCSWEEYHDAQADKRRHDEALVRDRDERRAGVKRQVLERQRQREVQERLKAERKAEEARQKAEAEEEAKRLAKMPPEERLLCELENGSLDQTAIGQRYPEIMKLEGEHLIRAATALKRAWQELGEWNVKPKKKKQFEKVQAVKKVLGES